MPTWRNTACLSRNTDASDGALRRLVEPRGRWLPARRPGRQPQRHHRRPRPAVSGFLISPTLDTNTRRCIDACRDILVAELGHARAANPPADAGRLIAKVSRGGTARRGGFGQERPSITVCGSGQSTELGVCCRRFLRVPLYTDKVSEPADKPRNRDSKQAASIAIWAGTFQRGQYCFVPTQ